jgi:hypothetical protein
MKNRKLNFQGIIYNRYLDESAVIAEDSRECFVRFMETYGLNNGIVDLHYSEKDGTAAVPDFSAVLNMSGEKQR